MIGTRVQPGEEDDVEIYVGDDDDQSFGPIADQPPP